MSLSDWADKNFYLSAECSYVEGPWETLPFQRAPMNSMGHPDIPVFNLIKSARVGYTQMLRAAVGYFAEHKQRNQIIYQPTDGAAVKFMKEHIQTMIRDTKVVKSIAPWLGSKHSDSTLDTKRFSNGKHLWVFGGKAAKNYREKSADNVYFDELAAFDEDIEKEGSPTYLGDKRLEGSVFPKSIRGSTPKLAGSCQITKAAEEAECYFRFYLPCPECTGEQYLKWGGADVPYGIKWQDRNPKTAHYVCEHCASIIENVQLESMQENGVWRCDNTGTTTKDGLSFFDKDGHRCQAPESVTYHIWTAYSLFTTWAKIVSDFLKALNDRDKIKTFTNTTLGETWEEDEGEQLDHLALYNRREYYPAEIPIEGGVLTCAVDTQDDRFEIEHVLWVSGEESYRISYERLYGDLSKSQIWALLKERISRQFKTPEGEIIETRLCLIDSGGHYTDEVYQFSKKNGVRKYIPIKGYNVPGKPIVNWPRKRNDKGVYLTMIGTDTAKELITDRLKQPEIGQGYMHYPISEQFDEDYFKHLTNEKRKLKIVKGRRAYVWDSGGKRNEPFDTSVYNLAAIRALQQHFGVKLPVVEGQSAPLENERPVKKKQKVQKRKSGARISIDDGFIDGGGDWI